MYSWLCVHFFPHVLMPFFYFYFCRPLESACPPDSAWLWRITGFSKVMWSKPSTRRKSMCSRPQPSPATTPAGAEDVPADGVAPAPPTVCACVIYVCFVYSCQALHECLFARAFVVINFTCLLSSLFVLLRFQYFMLLHLQTFDLCLCFHAYIGNSCQTPCAHIDNLCQTPCVQYVCTG